ncbi:MAG TPA: WS/DGAT domain-containing protein, partial [Conexibacter sp.]|nr:WS/DGAT domain-containing protein [Conexibacter sp.]
LAIKLHHCIADGMGALELAYRLLCEEPAAPPPKSPRPSATTLAGLPLAALREGADLLVHPRRIEHAVRSAGAGAELLAREQLDPAPQTSVNQPIGADRRYASVTIPLRQLTEIEHVLGGTVTDALLTTVAGALGRLLAARDEGCPADGLRAMVPVDVRRPDDVAEGNRISSLFVRLPVDVKQPLARHAAVKRETARVKHDDQQGGSSALVAVSGLAPPLLHRTLARLFATPRLFNLTVTSMRGPEQPLLVDGARLRQIHALVPLAPAHTLGVAIVSHAGATTFGVIADRDAVPDLDVFTAGLRASHAQLRRAAHRRAALGPGGAVQSALEGIPD